MILADRNERIGSIGRKSGSECLGEFAQRGMNDDAAVGRARRQVDRIELAQLEDMLRVDRVGIAQPTLDIRDR